MHPNEHLVRQAYEAQARGDVETYIGLLSDDFVLHLSGHSRIAGDYRGKDEIWLHLREIAELSSGTFQTEVHDVLADDEHVVGLVMARSRRRSSRCESHRCTPVRSSLRFLGTRVGGRRESTKVVWQRRGVLGRHEEPPSGPRVTGMLALLAGGTQAAHVPGAPVAEAVKASAVTQGHRADLRWLVTTVGRYAR
jgi:uncharacterized protein